MKKLNVLFLIFLAVFCGVLSFPITAQQSNEQAFLYKDFSKQLYVIEHNDDKQQAIEQFSQLLNSNHLSHQQRVTVLLKQALIHFQLSDYQQATLVTQQAKSIASDAGEFDLVAQADKWLGNIYYHQGELEQALSTYQQSLAYFVTPSALNSENNDSLIQQANLLNNIALVHTSLGDNSAALHHYQLAEPIYQEHGSHEDKADVRFNIAVLHVQLKRFDIAINMLKEVINKFETFGKENHIEQSVVGMSVAKATAALGVAYKQSGQYELARDHIASALEYFQAYEHKHDVASQLHNIAAIYNHLGDYDKAIDYGKKSVLLSKEVGHKKAYAGALQALAKAFFSQGKFIVAKEYIELSSAAAEKMNYNAVRIDNLAVSALINAALGNPSQALDNFFAYEKYQNEADNLMLNEHLAKFESQQLAQQVIQLEQKRKLQQLKATKAAQQRNFILLAVILLLLLSFFIYRRYLESRLTNELEKRVVQRTQELEHTTEELQEANQIKSQFLANMSHEIRTPLTAIVGHAEAIIHQDVSQEMLSKEVDIIHGNSLHLLDLINDILDLSKIEAGKFDLEIRPQNLEDIVHELLNMFNETAQKKGLTFKVTHQLSFPFVVHIDSRRLIQILINLCSNAIKFTAKGTVTLDIQWRTNQLTFSVVDTGIGLEKEQLSQIFETFAQADNSISRRFGGSGLGLSLSHQLSKLMGGIITVASEPGKGSRFCFTMPCTTPLYKSLQSVEVKPKPVSTKKRQFSGSILLAEDHDDNRRLISRLLSSFGLEVLCAKNGLEAVELCKEFQPALILLDIQMPEMDGVTAFSKIRELGFRQPIYALTANAMSHEISHYLAHGFTGHLKKPIERISFINTIARYYDETSDTVTEGETKMTQGDTRVVNTANTTDDFVFDDLIDEFKVNLDQELAALNAYLETKDQESLAKVTHRLSGAAQMFGFKELTQLAKELESYLKRLSAQTRPSVLAEQVKQNEFIDDLTHCLIDEINLIQSK